MSLPGVIDNPEQFYVEPILQTPTTDPTTVQGIVSSVDPNINIMQPLFQYDQATNTLTLTGTGTAVTSFNGSSYVFGGDTIAPPPVWDLPFLTIPTITSEGTLETTDILVKNNTTPTFYCNQDMTRVFNDLTIDGNINNPQLDNRFNTIQLTPGATGPTGPTGPQGPSGITEQQDPPGPKDRQD